MTAETRVTSLQVLRSYRCYALKSFLEVLCGYQCCALENFDLQES